MKAHQRPSIFVHITKEGLTAGPETSFKDFMELTASATLLTMRELVAQSPQDQREALEKDVYDAYNAIAGNVLHEFAPHLEETDSLTVDAILKAENELLDNATDEEFTKLMES